MTSPPSAPDSGPDPQTPVAEAYLRSESALKRFIRRFMRAAPDVDDIAQETFLRAYAVERDRPIEQPRSLLFRIAKHVALTQLTRKSRQITDYIEDSAGSEVVLLDHSAEDEVSGREMLGLHCEAVAELAPKCREVYLLRKVHGLSHKEIADRLGIAVSTVEKHLIKAVEQCHAYVEARTGGGRREPGGARHEPHGLRREPRGVKRERATLERGGATPEIEGAMDERDTATARRPARKGATP